jgi:hypothetical protein
MSFEPAAAANEHWPRTAVAASLLAVGLATAAAWWLAADEPDEPAAAVDAAPPATPFPTSFADVEKPSEPDARAVPVAVGADDEIQLCGGHWVKAAADGKPSDAALAAVVGAAFDEVSETVLAVMAASPSPRVQAAAHYFQAVDVASPSSSARDRSGQAGVHREALARLAQVTDDAQTYAWAYRSCNAGGTGTRGACMQVTAAQWARMDPENAEPWLALAEEARRRKDDAALDDAMFHVAAAERHQPGRGMLAATVAEYAPQDERSLLGTNAAIVHALGIEAADATVAWKETAEYCGAPAIADANRRETCERVATLLSDRSTMVLARAVGIGMGKRLGWDDDRLNALKEQQDAGSMAMRLMDSDAVHADPATCTAMRRNLERLRVMAEFGEIEMLRRDIAASGRSVAELAAGSRRQDEANLRRLAAEQAASSASAAAPAASVATLAQR